MAKKNKCTLCKQKIDNIDYKNVDLLSNFISEKYRILPKRVTKSCSYHQRKVAKAIKRARIVALIPFVELVK
jgi:small subunit ribosomal protein S18